MRSSNIIQASVRRSVSLVCVALLVLLPIGTPLFAQNPAQPRPVPTAPPPPPAPSLTPDQLDNMVAPVALYPDPLLGQVLSASTYPLEVVEAQQWLQQNPNLHGQQLIDAARQQNWDPSVQALVAFPDVMATLNRDIQWTTDLGNAFLAQQNDVMAAVQRMRQRAQQNGALQSNPQQTVTTQNQNGQSAVVIQPANPQVVYVPVYNPDYVWGPPVYGYYPPLWYPSIGFGFGFGPGIYLGSFFPGWYGFGWGWGFGWFGGGLFVNNLFFNHFGFHGFYGSPFRGGVGGRYAWAHDPYHRAGVGYANSAVASRYNNSRFAAGRVGRSAANAGGSYANNMARSSNYGSMARGFANSNPRSFGNSSRGYAGGSNQSYGRNYGGSAFNGSRGYSTPNNFNRGSYFSGSRGYSAPNNFGGGRSYGGGGFGGASRSFSGGGFSGGRSFGGGGGHSGGGGHGGGRR